jgi:uncharacterized membrane protein YkvA (DUF1232 family)
MEALDILKNKARQLKKELKVLYVAYRRPEVPWYTKVMAAVVIGYALSPIDLIPDFIPVLGYLDDILLIPLGIYLVKRLIPTDVLEHCRSEAEEAFIEGKPKNWIAAGVIVLLWILVIAMIVYKFLY